MIADSWDERGDEQEQAQRGGDHCGFEAGASGSNGTRCGAGVRRIEAHDLGVERQVRRHGCREAYQDT